MVSEMTPEQQLREIHRYRKLWNLRFDLYELRGEWWWALVREADQEPVWLCDHGWTTVQAAIHDAWCCVWPGRMVRTHHHATNPASALDEEGNVA
jgi:hypothetical protein